MSRAEKLLKLLEAQGLKVGTTVVFMAKGHKLDQELATIVSNDDSLHSTIKFKNGTTLTAVRNTDLRGVEGKL